MAEEQQQEIKLIAVKCPNCGAVVNVPEGSKSAQCLFCQEYFNPQEVINKPKRSLAKGGLTGASAGARFGGDAGGLIQGIQNAESAYAYATSVYDEMDWEGYQENDYQYRIDEVVDLLNEIRITCSNSKTTYLLEFDSYVIPYQKKIEGIDKCDEKIIKALDEANETDANSAFSIRDTIVKTIKADKEEILKKLQFDIEQYEKYGAEKDEVAALKERFNEFEKLFDGLEEVNEINDIPAIQKHFEEKDKAIGEELLAQGILVQQEYERAMQLRSEGKINPALNILIKLKGYRDSNIIIAKENELFTFNDYYESAGKPYYYQREQRFRDVVGSDKKVTRELVGETDNLYEIVDGRPSKEPVLRDVTRILCRFGTRILYLNINNEIKMFDFSVNQDIVVDASKSFTAGFKNTFIDSYSSIFAYERRNSDKSSAPVAGGSDEFEMVEVRLTDATPSVDTLFRYSSIDYKAGRIFAYKHKIVVEEQEGKKTIKKVKMVENSYDFLTRRTRKSLDKDAHVRFWSGEFLYYVRYSKTPYNLDIYRFDLREPDDQEEKVIVRNAYDLLDVDEHKIFYTVGCEFFNTFYSLNIDTGEKLELFKNVTERFTRKGGYFYMTKKDRYNSYYFKIKEDGSKRILLATNFEASRGIKNGFLYYLDNDKTLKRVRLDGTDEQTLIYHYENGNVMRITDSRIYCSLWEDVDIVDDEPVSGCSLISFDTYGHKIEKHLFNFTDGKFRDDENLIYSILAQKQFKIKNPDKNMNPIVYRDILTYFKLNIKTHEQVELFSTGSPEGFKEPRGCFKKRRDPLIFEEVVEEKHYD